MSINRADLCFYPYDFFDADAMWDYNMRNGSKAVYAVTKAWDHASVTWKSPWSTEGGDFEAQSALGHTSADTTALRWEKVDVTAAVKKWISNPSSNNGFIIIFDDYDRRGIMVYSSESKETAFRPKLVINGTDITGIIQKNIVVHSSVNLIKTGSGLMLELPAANGWETATVYGFGGRMVASVRLQTNRETYTINGVFCTGACLVRLKGKNSEKITKVIIF